MLPYLFFFQMVSYVVTHTMAESELISSEMVVETLGEKNGKNESLEYREYREEDDMFREQFCNTQVYTWFWSVASFVFLISIVFLIIMCIDLYDASSV